MVVNKTIQNVLLLHFMGGSVQVKLTESNSVFNSHECNMLHDYFLHYILLYIVLSLLYYTLACLFIVIVIVLYSSMLTV